MTKLFGSYHLCRTGQQGLPLNTPTVDNRTNSPAQAATSGAVEQRPKNSRVAEIVWRSRLLSLCLTKNRPSTAGVAEQVPSLPIAAEEAPQPIDTAAHTASNDRLTTLPPELQLRILAELPYEGRRSYALLNKKAYPLAKLTLTNVHVDNLEELNTAMGTYGNASMQSLVIRGRFLRDEHMMNLPASLEHLDVSGCWHLTGEGLAQALRRLPNLRTLSLTGCSSLTNDGIREGLRHTPQLQKLSLARCQFLTEQGITDALQQVPQLQALDLSECASLTGTEITTALQDLPHLRQLNLSGCTSLTAVTLSSNLQDLDLSACRRLTNIGLQEGGPSALTRIDLSNCDRMSSTTLNPLLQNIPNLIHLDISWCNQLTNLVLPNLPRLEHLDASRCPGVTNANFNNQPAIKYLTLRGCNTLDALNLSGLNALENFDARDCTDLQHLTIANNENLRKIDIGECFQLENLTMENLPALEDIDLSAYGRGVRRVDLRVLQNVGTKIKTINVSGRYLNDETMPDLSSFAELDTLDLSRTRILGSSLPERLPPSLKTLRMSESRITDKRLSKVLTTCRELTHLDLSRSANITGAGLKPLRRQFPVTLQSLNIRDCAEVSNEAIEKLRSVLPGVITNH